MIKKVPVGLSLPKELLARIDIDRGKVPRSVWIVDLLKKALEEPKESDKQ